LLELLGFQGERREHSYAHFSHLPIIGAWEIDFQK